MVNNQSVTYILGAGVDKQLGMPLANELIRDLGTFATGPGKPVADAIRGHLPRLRFSFAKYSGEQGENFAERVLVEDPQALTTAKAALDRYAENHRGEGPEHVEALRTVIGALEDIRDKNSLEDHTLQGLAQISGDDHQQSGGDFIFNPRGLALTPVVRQAFRKTFQGLVQSQDLSEGERETLTTMALSMMNVEELLGELFSGFYTQHKTHQKQYLYVAWLCWAYLRLKMEEALTGGVSPLYQHLATLPENSSIITLNYTSKFLPAATRAEVYSFHGDCLSYIRFDTRRLVNDDESLLRATTVDSIAAFISSLAMDLDNNRLFLPGIVPPLSVKPVICREHLDTWYRCGRAIDSASTIVIVGYSFNMADEHLNDLLRKRRGASDVKIVVVNPDIDGTSKRFCAIAGQAFDQLDNLTKADFSCRKAGNLLFVNATTEQLTSDSLGQLLD